MRPKRDYYEEKQLLIKKIVAEPDRSKSYYVSFVLAERPGQISQAKLWLVLGDLEAKGYVKFTKSHLDIRVSPRGKALEFLKVSPSPEGVLADE